ncbi:hypothetical protein IG631_18460 [Alternaria alternata]|nr:hypothetical protein IG631_18460 [Alternaria alternata]
MAGGWDRCKRVMVLGLGGGGLCCLSQLDSCELLISVFRCWCNALQPSPCIAVHSASWSNRGQAHLRATRPSIRSLATTKFPPLIHAISSTNALRLHQVRRLEVRKVGCRPARLNHVIA